MPLNLYEEFAKIAQAFQIEGISYVLIGGIAMAFHAHPRFTEDIDILTTPDQIEPIRLALSGLEYLETAAPWRFRNSEQILHRFMKTMGEDYFLVDVVAGADQRTADIIRNAVEDRIDEAIVKVARREDLIYLKSQRNSTQDRADIENLQHDSSGKNPPQAQ